MRRGVLHRMATVAAMSACLQPGGEGGSGQRPAAAPEPPARCPRARINRCRPTAMHTADTRLNPYQTKVRCNVTLNSFYKPFGNHRPYLCLLASRAAARLAVTACRTLGLALGADGGKNAWTRLDRDGRAACRPSRSRRLAGRANRSREQVMLSCVSSYRPIGGVGRARGKVQPRASRAVLRRGG